MSDLDVLNEMLADAEEAELAAESLSGFTNHGKLTVELEKYKFVKNENTGKNERVVIDSEEYRKLPRNEKKVDVIFKVDIQELKPSLTFSYERKVTHGRADWNKLVAPSIVDVLHLAENENVLTALVKLSGKYVFINDVPNAEGKKSSNGNLYKVPVLTNVFETREAYLEAVQARFGSVNGVEVEKVTEETDPNVPKGYKDWEEFSETIRVLRESDKMSNVQIAKELQIDLSLIAKVK